MSPLPGILIVLAASLCLAVILLEFTGQPVWVSSVTAQEAPAPPGNVRASWEGSSVRVSWDSSPGATHYKVYHDAFFDSNCRVHSFGSVLFCEELSSSVSGTSYQHDGPDLYENYYWVTACNDTACSTIDSDNPTRSGEAPQTVTPTVTPMLAATPQTLAPTVTPAPAATPQSVPASPGNVRASWDGSSVRVSWDGSPGATHYKVYHDDFHDSGCQLNSSSWWSFFFGSTSFCDVLSSSVSGTSYQHDYPDRDKNYYWVTACNSAGCSDIDSDNPVLPGGAPPTPIPTATLIPTHTATPQAATRLATPTPTLTPTATLTPAATLQSVPASPRNVRASWDGSAVRVSWDGSAGATHYKVYHDSFFDSNCRVNSLGRASFCEELSSGVSGTYQHDDPDKDENYYWVTACNSIGCSSIDSDNPALPGGAGTPTPTATPLSAPTPTPTATPLSASIPMPTATPQAEPESSLCASGGAVSDATLNPRLVSDCEALMAASAILVGNGRRLNWSYETPINGWTGVTIRGTPRHVIGLELISKRLRGSIPEQLGNLTNLTVLRLNGNQLRGSIPEQLGNLTNLTSLDLGDNQLSGSIPTQVGNLTNLTSLDLGDNQLSGSIPAQLGNLTNLKFLLVLNDNQLSGSMPAQLGNLTNLTYLRLNGNQLSGSIPIQLGNMTNLTWLRLNDNQLSGSIPAQLGKLTYLEDLYLSDNQLSGCIPPALRNVRNHDLDKLGLRDCKLNIFWPWGYGWGGGGVSLW